MKTELATAIGAAIAGVLIAYFVTGLFIGPIAEVSFPSIGESVNMNLSEPDPEVFNYKALNPTVEVYVGDCAEYNEAGECIEEVAEEQLQTLEDSTTIQPTDQNTEESTEAGQETNQTESDSTEQGNP